MNRNRCVIVVPLYKEVFNYDEYNSIKNLFKVLPVEKYDIVAFCPQSLDLSYYNSSFRFVDYYYFYDSYFENYPIGYNSLMLNSGFYKCFEKYEYMLIHQPDCWVFRDELEYWCDQGYSYIGAPNVYNAKDKYWLCQNTFVGNGGFSLRNIQWMIYLCETHKEECQTLWEMSDTMFGEDHITLHLDFMNVDLKAKLPTFIECAKFSFEVQPHMTYQMLEYHLPFGCHAYNKIIDKDFWDEFIVYEGHKLYTVVTFLFGDYDILRDPDEIDDNAEYICITDRDDLKSDIWNFVKLNYPNVDQYSSWQKSMIARYTALEYSNTDVCLIMDASVHLKKSPYKYILQMKCMENKEGTYLIHPWRDSYLEEYDEWIAKRGLDPIQKEQFIEYCSRNNYDVNSRGMIMTTIMIQKNNEFNKTLNDHVLFELLSNFNFSQRVDQTYFSIIFTTHYFRADKAFAFISMQALDSDYFEYYYHGTDATHAGEYKYDFTKIDYKYLCNRKYPCIYLV